MWDVAFALRDSPDVMYVRSKPATAAFGAAVVYKVEEDGREAAAADVESDLGRVRCEGGARFWLLEAMGTALTPVIDSRGFWECDKQNNREYQISD